MLPVVTSGYIPVLIHTPVVLARERGYFADAGIDVRLERLPNGRDIVPKLLSGTLDIAIGGPGPDFWQAIAVGHAIRLLAPLHAERPPAVTPLIVHADLFDSGEIQAVEDLRGRPVSSPSGGAPLFWLHSALQAGGLTVDDIDLSFVTYSEVGAAFERGEIDAALLGEPLAADLVERRIAVRLESDFVDGLQPTYLYALAQTVERRRDELARFVAAYLRACADLETGDPERGWDAPSTIRTVARFTDVPGDEIAESMRPIFEPQGRFRHGSLQRIHDFFISRGEARPMPGFEPDSLIDESLVQEALRQAGPYARGWDR